MLVLVRVQREPAVQIHKTSDQVYALFIYASSKALISGILKEECVVL